jgi:hypothetical protein
LGPDPRYNNRHPNQKPRGISPSSPATPPYVEDLRNYSLIPPGEPRSHVRETSPDISLDWVPGNKEVGPSHFSNLINSPRNHLPEDQEPPRRDQLYHPPGQRRGDASQLDRRGREPGRDQDSVHLASADFGGRGPRAELEGGNEVRNEVRPGDREQRGGIVPLLPPTKNRGPDATPKVGPNQINGGHEKWVTGPQPSTNSQPSIPPSGLPHRQLSQGQPSVDNNQGRICSWDANFANNNHFLFVDTMITRKPRFLLRSTRSGLHASAFAVVPAWDSTSSHRFSIWCCIYGLLWTATHRQFWGEL